MTVPMKIFLYAMGSILLLLLGVYVGRSEERMERAEFHSRVTAQGDRVQDQENETLLAIRDTLLKIEADLKSAREVR